MSNELAELQFQVNYTPSDIAILNEGKLAELVESTAKTYESYVFTDDNVPEAKKARQELNKIAEKIDEERKKVKKSYQEPLDSFEKKMKSYYERIKDVSQSIGKNLSTYEEKQRLVRLEVIKEFIAEESKKLAVNPNEVEIESSWLNQTSFTTKGAPIKKVKDAISLYIQSIADEKQRILDEKNTVEQFAQLAGLEAFAWVAMVDKGISSSDIIAQMKQAIERKKQEEAEAERKRIEGEKRETERQQKLKEEKVAEDSQSIIKKTELEVTEEPVYQSSKLWFRRMRANPPIDDETMEFTLHIKGKKSALYELNEFMTKKGIEFKKVVVK